MSTFNTLQPKDYTIEQFYATSPMSWELQSSSFGILPIYPEDIDGAISFNKATNDATSTAKNLDTGITEYGLYSSVRHLFYDNGTFYSGSVLTKTSPAPLQNKSYVLSVGRNFYGDRIKPGSFELALTPGQQAISTDSTASTVMYLGESTTFSVADISVYTAGSYPNGVSWKYWNGTAWANLPSLNETTPGITEFETTGTGSVSWSTPGDWAQKTISGSTLYWIKIQSNTTVTGVDVAPLLNYIAIGSGSASTTYPVSILDDSYGNLYISQSGTGSYIGNIFYEDGIAVIKEATGSTHSSISSTGLKLTNGAITYIDYDSQVKITRHQVNIKLDPDRCNFPLLNPSIKKIFSTTGSVTQSLINAGVPQKAANSWSFHSLLKSNIIKPYVTSIGLYDDNYQLLAVAKFSTPIQRSFDIDQIFIVRFDT